MESLFILIVVIIVINLLNALSGGRRQKGTTRSPFPSEGGREDVLLGGEEEDTPSGFDYREKYEYQPRDVWEETPQIFHREGEAGHPESSNYKVNSSPERATANVDAPGEEAPGEFDRLKTSASRKRRQGIDRSSANTLLNFTGNEVVKGFVWKEILGPPRSRQPRSSRHSH